MDQHRSVCRYTAYESLLHQIDDHRRESRLDYMPADSPDDRLLQLTRTPNSLGQLTKRSHRKHIRQTIEKLLQRGISTGRLRKLLEINFARTRGERIRFYFIELER